MLSAFADNLKNTVKALDITWKGMLGIFLVIGIIYIVVTVLNIVTVEDKRKAVAQKIKGFFKKK
jgi:amino acid transporter